MLTCTAHRLAPSRHPSLRAQVDAALLDAGERLIKTGARLVRHGRYAIFQMAEAAMPRQVFASILERDKSMR